MLNILRRVLGRNDVVPAAYNDPTYGEFSFSRGLGWIKRTMVGSNKIDLVFGSDGERPSNEMIRTLQELSYQWATISPKVVDFIEREFCKSEWASEPDLPDPKTFVIRSINVLWPDRPTIAIVYFQNNEDEEREWHMTFDGTEPVEFAFDH